MGEFQLSRAIGGLVTKTNWYFKTYFNKLIHEQGYAITVEQWTLLLIIRQNPAKTQTEIAQIGLKDKTNVTRILDILQKNNYIERRADASDRRKYRIHLTHAGDKIMRALFPIAEQVNIRATAGLNQNECSKLRQLLQIIINNLKALI